MQETGKLRDQPIFSDRYGEALAYAHRIHQHQARKGCDTPYIAHLLAVSSLVIEHGGSEDEAIAALLHDALEDLCPPMDLAALKQEIKAKFGTAVLAIVEDCSDCETAEHKPSWPERKAAYIAHLGTASPSVLKVSAADKLHNVRSLLSDYRQIGEALWSRFNAGRNDQLGYYRKLAQTFTSRDKCELFDELARAVDALFALVQHADAARANKGDVT